jgi:hypothetical protein
MSCAAAPDEVSYQDFLAGRKRDSTEYAKIAACCEYEGRDVQMPHPLEHVEDTFLLIRGG